MIEAVPKVLQMKDFWYSLVFFETIVYPTGNRLHFILKKVRNAFSGSLVTLCRLAIPTQTGRNTGRVKSNWVSNLIHSQIRAKAHCHCFSINHRHKSGVKESSDPQRGCLKSWFLAKIAKFYTKYAKLKQF